MNLPNKLTILRAILIPFMVVAFYIDMPVFAIIATAIFVIAAITDFLDGYIARKHNLVTDFGKFMDPLADKALVLVALILIVDKGIIQIPYLAAVSLSIILVRELMISALRLVAANKGIVIAADKLGKAKTFTQDFAIPFLFLANPSLEALFGTVCHTVFYWIGLVLLGVSTVLAVISGVSYMIKNKAAFAEQK